MAKNTVGETRKAVDRGGKRETWRISSPKFKDNLDPKQKKVGTLKVYIYNRCYVVLFFQQGPFSNSIPCHFVFGGIHGDQKFSLACPAGVAGPRNCRGRGISASSSSILLKNCRNRTDSLGGGFKYFLFSSLFGEMIQFD